MIKMLPIVKTLALTIIIALLTGCWDNKDINHRTLPIVMGISCYNNIYQVFLQIPEPVENRLRIKIVEEEGHTITQAIDRISENMESQIDLLHLKVILLDKKLASTGMNDVFSYLVRSKDISPKALVVLSEEEPRVFFESTKDKVNPEGNNFPDFFEKDAGWNPQIALTRIWQVYRSVHSYTQDVVLPIVRPGRSTTIDHVGSAIIKNGRMVGQINADETLLVNMFHGHSAQGKIEVMEHASILINQASIRHHAQVIDGKPGLKTHMTITVSILENRGNVSANIIKKELSELINSRFERLFTQARREQADILSLGQEFRKIFPRWRLKDWRDKIYPDLNVDFDVNIIIQDQGFLKGV